MEWFALLPGRGCRLLAPKGWISLLSVPPQYTWAVPHHTLPADCADVAAQAGVLPGGSKAQPGADDASVTGNPRNDFNLGAALPADVPPTVEVPPTMAEASRPHHSEPLYSSYDSLEVMAAVTAVAFSDSSVSSADTNSGSMPISRADSEDATIPPWLRTDQPRADDTRAADAGVSSPHRGGLGVGGSHADSASMPPHSTAAGGLSQGQDADLPQLQATSDLHIRAAVEASLEIDANWDFELEDLFVPTDAHQQDPRQGIVTSTSHLNHPYHNAAALSSNYLHPDVVNTENGFVHMIGQSASNSTLVRWQAASEINTSAARALGDAAAAASSIANDFKSESLPSPLGTSSLEVFSDSSASAATALKHTKRGLAAQQAARTFEEKQARQEEQARLQREVEAAARAYEQARLQREAEEQASREQRSEASNRGTKIDENAPLWYNSRLGIPNQYSSKTLRPSQPTAVVRDQLRLESEPSSSRLVRAAPVRSGDADDDTWDVNLEEAVSFIRPSNAEFDHNTHELVTGASSLHLHSEHYSFRHGSHQDHAGIALKQSLYLQYSKPMRPAATDLSTALSCSAPGYASSPVIAAQQSSPPLLNGNRVGRSGDHGSQIDEGGSRGPVSSQVPNGPSPTRSNLDRPNVPYPLASRSKPFRGPAPVPEFSRSPLAGRPAACIQEETTRNAAEEVQYRWNAPQSLWQPSSSDIMVGDSRRPERYSPLSPSTTASSAASSGVSPGASVTPRHRISKFFDSPGLSPVHSQARTASEKSHVPAQLEPSPPMPSNGHSPPFALQLPVATNYQSHTFSSAWRLSSPDM